MINRYAETLLITTVFLVSIVERDNFLALRGTDK